MFAKTQQQDKQRLQMTRLAVSTFFFLNGVMTATLSARLPAIQTKLALPAGQLGLALLGCTVSGLVAMNVTSRLTRYTSSRSLTPIATLAMGLALPLIAFAPSLFGLLVALACFGAGSGAMDITMNIQGTAVERAYARPVFMSFYRRDHLRWRYRMFAFPFSAGAVRAKRA